VQADEARHASAAA